MDYKIQHIPISPNRRIGRKTKMTSITIHSTANPKSSAASERNWLVNPSNTRTASWHIAVDDKMAVEAIPLDEVAWHAGSSTGNNSSIGIEICESGDRLKTIKNAVDLSARLLYERGWGTPQMKRHFDWSGKNCPNIMSANNWALWNQFVKDVQEELNRLKGVGPVLTNPSAVSNKVPSGWAKIDWEWAVAMKLFDGTNPQGNITREQMAAVMRRFYDLVK